MGTRLASEHPALIVDLGAPLIPLALVAKRRRDDRQHAEEDIPTSQVVDVDLQFFDERVAALIYAQLPSDRSGLCELVWPAAGAPPSLDDPVVVSHRRGSSWAAVSYARPGGQLEIDERSSAYSDLALLHDGGRLIVVHDGDSALRALALRHSRRDLVVLDGPSDDVDIDVRQRLVTIVRPTASSPVVRVRLLRPEPIIAPAGFIPSDMRRRVTELAAYLALHRRDPVTGDRLRTRVTGSSDRDGSPRVLANLASALRRALGNDDLGMRLHTVTHDGLYRSHGLISDVEEFLQLVDEAQRYPELAITRLTCALDLVEGEPLAACLASYEWFVTEGHAARLARAGEWAGLALASRCVERGDVERAYWALDQARLLDPYSDDLIGAQARVPRLREFGGDGTCRTQDESVRSRGTVLSGGSFDRLTEQVAE
jgi:hypothetical protein